MTELSARGGGTAKSGSQEGTPLMTKFSSHELLKVQYEFRDSSQLWPGPGVSVEWYKPKYQSCYHRKL